MPIHPTKYHKMWEDQNDMYETGIYHENDQLPLKHCYKDNEKVGMSYAVKNLRRHLKVTYCLDYKSL